MFKAIRDVFQKDPTAGYKDPNAFPYAAYHKAERLWTLRHPDSINGLPIADKPLDLMKEFFMGAIFNPDDFSSNITEVRAWLEANKWESLEICGKMDWAQCHLEFYLEAACHFADMENAIRDFQGRPLMPVDAQIIAKHWLAQ